MRAETPTKTDQTCSETVVQFDIQESPSRMEQAEQRFKLTETMRKFSSLGRHSISQSEHTRKPFFTLTKSPKIVLQPGSSTSNLSKTTRQIIDTPTVYISEENPWGEYTSHVLHPPSLEVLSDQFSETRKQCDFENTQLPDTFNADTSDSSHSDTCQLQCHHTNMCPLRPSDINLSIPAKAVTSKAKSPKYLVRRHKSLEAGKKKGIQWRKIIKTYQKEKPEDILVAEEMIPYTRSSPNLKHLDKCSQTPVKDTSDDDIDSSSKEE